MQQIAVLSTEELETLLQKTARVVAMHLQDHLERARTPELMTKAQLAKYLVCDPSKINRYMKQGLPYEVFGEHPRFRKIDIDAWLKSNVSFQKISGKTDNDQGQELV